MRDFFEKRLILHVFAIATLALLAACGGEEPTQSSPMSIAPPLPPMLESLATDEGAGVAATVAAKAGQAPDAAVRQAMKAIADGKIETAWDMLPSSYQNDITSVVSDLGNAIDPIIWAQFASIVEKSVELARTRKSELMEVATPMMSGKSPATVEAEYGKFLAAIEALGQSKVLDLEFLKKPDLRALLATDAARLIESVPALGQATGAMSVEQNDSLQARREAMRTARVEIVDQDGETATLEVTVGEDTQTLTLQVVEGKWVPREMAEGWAAGIEGAKAVISGISQSMATNKENAIETLTMLEHGVDSLLAAQDADEMGRLLQSFFMVVGGQAGGGGMTHMPTFADLAGRGSLSHTRGATPDTE